MIYMYRKNPLVVQLRSMLATGSEEKSEWTCLSRLVDAATISFAYLDFIGNLLVLVLFALNDHLIYLIIGVSIMVLSHIITAVRLYQARKHCCERPRSLCEMLVSLAFWCCGTAPSLIAWFDRNRSNAGSFRLQYARLLRVPDEASSSPLEERMMFLCGFYHQCLLLTLPMWIFKCVALSQSVGLEENNMIALLLNVSIFISILSVCCNASVFCARFSINQRLFIFHWLCLAADMFIILVQIMQFSLYYDETLANILFYELIVGVLPIAIAMLIMFTAEDLQEAFYDGCYSCPSIVCCCCMAPIMIAFAVFGLHCVCFVHFAFLVRAIGYGRFPTNPTVCQFYRKIYEWSILEARSFDADTLEISVEQDQAIRLGAFHKHCSYFIQNSAFKQFVISKGEETGFMDVTLDAFKANTLSNIGQFYCQPISECKREMEELRQSERVVIIPQSLHWKLYFSYVLCYICMPLYALSRCMHICWSVIVFAVMLLDGMSEFEMVLNALYICFIPGIAMAYYVAMRHLRSDAFHDFLSHVFPHCDELPELFLAWGYFGAIQKVYELTMVVPARNALLEETFGKDITRLIVNYLSALDEGMPARPGGG